MTTFTHTAVAAFGQICAAKVTQIVTEAYPPSPRGLK